MKEFGSITNTFSNDELMVIVDESVVTGIDIGKLTKTKEILGLVTPIREQADSNKLSDSAFREFVKVMLDEMVKNNLGID